MREGVPARSRTGGMRSLAPLQVRTPAPKPARGRRGRNGRQEPKEKRRILVVDIGGSKVKLYVSGRTKPLRIRSGPDMTPDRMVQAILQATAEWGYDVVTIGYPGRVGREGLQSEPRNLGPGWVGFDFGAAFRKPVRVINDAALQALGSYDGGRMLFLGLGTGVGSTVIVDDAVIPLELGELPAKRKRTVGEVLGAQGLEKLGKRRWRKELTRIVNRLAVACAVDYVVLGGGNAKLVTELPPAARLGNNLAAFKGGVRLWGCAGVQTWSPEGHTEDELAPDQRCLIVI